MMEKTNELLEDLTTLITRSNKILVMVNCVNIATMIVLLGVIIYG